jgi:cyanophycinase-like exopeptidase
MHISDRKTFDINSNKYIKIKKEENNLDNDRSDISDACQTLIKDDVKVYLSGNPEDVKTPTSSGVCLMGGNAEVDGAMKWMINKSGGGDFVILRADDSDGYNDYLYKELGGVNSVRTLVIDSKEKANSPYVEEAIKNAEAVFLAGGDQGEYYKNWNGTRVEEAINHIANEKKVPVGGTSAGCNSMGGLFYSAENGGVTSEEALENPFNSYMTFRTDFLSMPRMKYIITDTHFHTRDRMGRSVTFLSRMVEDNFQSKPVTPKVISVDEKTAVTIDSDGSGKVWSDSKDGHAYFLETSERPQVCQADMPLTFNHNVVKCYSIKGNQSGNGSFDINDDGSWENFKGGKEYNINITEGKFEADPY